MRALFIAVLLSFSVAAIAAPKPEARDGALLYQVRQKDHLAEILRSMGYENLWGSKGMVARTIQANSALSKSADELEPSSWIYIPARSLPNTGSFEIVDGEIRRLAKGKKGAAPPEKRAAAAPSLARRARTAAPLSGLASQPQNVHVRCPDQTIREARIQLLEPQNSNEPATIVVFDKNGICQPLSIPVIPPIGAAAPVAVEPPAPAAPVAATEAAPPSAPPQLVESQEKAAPGNEAAGKPAPVDTPKSRDISQLPFFLSPLAGFMSKSIELGGAGGSPSATGHSVGLRFGYVYRVRDWGYLADVTYRQAQLISTDATADYLTMNMLEYGLGLSYRNWTARAGLANNNATNASKVGNFSFADRGYYAALAYSIYFNARLSASVEGRYTGITYMKSNNSALASDAISTQLETLLTLEYRFAFW